MSCIVIYRDITLYEAIEDLFCRLDDFLLHHGHDLFRIVLGCGGADDRSTLVKFECLDIFGELFLECSFIFAFSYSSFDIEWFLAIYLLRRLVVIGLLRVWILLCLAAC